jgi:multidrug efflux pump subunit AcrA (membrane-fusion protein)
MTTATKPKTKLTVAGKAPAAEVVPAGGAGQIADLAAALADTLATEQAALAAEETAIAESERIAAQRRADLEARRAAIADALNAEQRQREAEAQAARAAEMAALRAEALDRRAQLEATYGALKAATCRLAHLWEDLDLDRRVLFDDGPKLEAKAAELTGTRTAGMLGGGFERQELLFTFRTDRDSPEGLGVIVDALRGVAHRAPRPSDLPPQKWKP